MIIKIVIGFWMFLLGKHLLINIVDAQIVLSPEIEALDDLYDAQIFRAVVRSMREWELKKRYHAGYRSKRETSRVCYGDLGCFEGNGPFSYLEMLPSSPKDVGTRFLVYGSRKARSIPMELSANNISHVISTHVIDTKLPTKVIVHGFGSGCDYIWVYELRAALTAVLDCNIVCVDWAPGSALPNYVKAAANTRLVGRQLANLVRSLKVPLEKLHLIGFSLGAHVAGFAGSELGNVSRITGLDPAGPLFESQHNDARLDESDANFVDVIHSNGEQLILGGLGSWQPMGDVDFYPNGGRMQSGCTNLFVGAVSDIINFSTNPIEGRSLCNHRRAYKLFTDSVSPQCRFPAFSCESGYDGLLKGECFPCGTKETPCGDMGFYSYQSPGRGQLYLVTRDEEPFCAHQYLVQIYNSIAERLVRSYGKLQIMLISDSLHSINETFTMTKKDDEELFVGERLQRIVVPHPALLHITAVEIKYIAYNGWISSGLSFWSIDKISIMDSYGKISSFCRNNLVLESGRPIHIKLQTNNCNFNSKNSVNSSKVMRSMGVTGIGPFIRGDNLIMNKNLENEVPQISMETVSYDLNRKTHGKEKEVAISTTSDDDFVTRPSAPAHIKSFGISRRNYESTSRPWLTLHVSKDEPLNPFYNYSEDTERGRSFSNAISDELPLRPFNFSGDVEEVSEQISESSFEIRDSIEFSKSLSSVRAALNQSMKNITGRSLGITEVYHMSDQQLPVFRPARTRIFNGDEVLDESTSSRIFAVSFLPGRLAGLLAHAEKYARETLIPLISQYTPSFVSSKSDKPKFFPLGNLFVDKAKLHYQNSINENFGIKKKDWVDVTNFSSSTVPIVRMPHVLEQPLLIVSNESSWVPVILNNYKRIDSEEQKWIDLSGEAVEQIAMQSEKFETRIPSTHSNIGKTVLREKKKISKKNFVDENLFSSKADNPFESRIEYESQLKKGVHKIVNIHIPKQDKKLYAHYARSSGNPFTDYENNSYIREHAATFEQRYPLKIKQNIESRIKYRHLMPGRDDGLGFLAKPRKR